MESSMIASATHISTMPSTHPARRKSCRECVKAKRRCDQRSPDCSRCANRNLACEYLQQTQPLPSPQPSSAGSVNIAPMSTTESLPSNALSFGTATDSMNNFEFGLDFDLNASVDVLSMPKDMDSPGDMIRQPWMGFVENSNKVYPRAQSIGQSYCREDYRKMLPICVCCYPKKEACFWNSMLTIL